MAMAGEKKKALIRLPLILLLVILAVAGLVAYWLHQEDISHHGRLYPDKSTMCQQFATSYLRTIKEVENIDDFGSDTWLRAVDIETEIHKLCQLELTNEAIRNYQPTALEKYSTSSTDDDPSLVFWLCEDDPLYLEVSKPVALEIEKVIDAFERLKYQRDFVGAIKMLTPPQTQEEEAWFGHLLGTDLKRFKDGDPSPRFLNKVNFHLSVGYDVEKITKRGDVFYVHIKELRVINVANEGAISDYVTDIQDLTFEVIDNGESYQISRYYHTNPTSLVDLKYEGFVAG